ncbi:hypothetical protein [Paenibacillus koleovorans]|uniref:hypothetical protein n=1 Tax=Paenibacillus koleovorans TaxID=121608 RepID=UPI000FDA89F4|nr:hypothetical protein [Paenibacillus koleovorans]
MSNARSTIRAAGLAGLVCLLLAGCTASTGEPSPTPTPSASAQPTASPTITPVPSVTATATPTATPTVSVKPSTTPTPSTKPIHGNVPSAEAQKLIADRTAAVIQALKKQDMKQLAGFAHPEKGIRFSPYTHVDLTNDLVVAASSFGGAMTDVTVRNWGSYDGSGEPIQLKFSDYYAKFVYNHDFANPETIGYNQEIGKGNMINNTRTAYPAAIIVEYHFSGFDPAVQGHDWASLKLVYEHFGGNWMLVGIVHDQWTI